MPFCPKCLTEYVEGVVECEDCRAPLQPGSPPERAASPDELARSPGGKLVAIRAFEGPTARVDAELARNVLETQGVTCVLPGDDTAYPVFEVLLLVREEEAAKAATILQGFLDSSPPVGEE